MVRWLLEVDMDAYLFIGNGIADMVVRMVEGMALGRMQNMVPGNLPGNW
jgi:hypothetical protein